jgi:hypothetical protein
MIMPRYVLFCSAFAVRNNLLAAASSAIRLAQTSEAKAVNEMH